MAEQPPKRRGAGLKIDNKNSSIPTPVQNNTAAFDQKANAAHTRIEGYKNRIWDLGTKLKAMFENKILQPNKTLLSKDLEKEITGNLINLALEMDNDETQPNGQGSTALCSLIFKMMLIQRDQLNEQSFQLELLRREIVKSNTNK